MFDGLGKRLDELEDMVYAEVLFMKACHADEQELDHGVVDDEHDVVVEDALFAA